MIILHNVRPLEFLAQERLSSISAEEVASIEEKTRSQSENKMWHDERKKRITASNFGTIYHATDRRDKVKLAASLLNPPKLDNVAAW